MKIIYAFGIGIAMCAGISCNKLLDLKSPPNQLTDDKIFSSDNNVLAAVINIYPTLSSLPGNSTVYLGIYSDELGYNSNNSDIAEFANSRVLPKNVYIGNFWRASYDAIYQCNLLIKGLEGNTVISTQVNQMATGEAKFIRAWCYFQLVNMYGDVPLVLSPDVTASAFIPRTPLVDVHKQIVEDLKSAYGLLKPEYPTADRFRVNKWTCLALLAREYAYTGDWDNAKITVDALMQPGTYALAPLATMMKKNSPEVIWQLWNANGYSDLGLSFNPTAGIPNYSFRGSFLNAFDPADGRKTTWTKTVTISAINYTVPFKYKNNTITTGTSAEYTTCFRLGEQYLIRAEALTNKGLINEALLDINMIRNRATLPSIIAPITKDSCLKLVENERKFELFTEWGLRFFDLKHLGKLDEVIGSIKSGWVTTGNLFPIPQAEININPQLNQNSGY